MSGPYYAAETWRLGRAWTVWKNTSRGGRKIAGDMSERTARRVARLLNADEKVQP